MVHIENDKCICEKCEKLLSDMENNFKTNLEDFIRKDLNEIKRYLNVGPLYLDSDIFACQLHSLFNLSCKYGDEFLEITKFIYDKIPPRIQDNGLYISLSNGIEFQNDYAKTIKFFESCDNFLQLMEDEYLQKKYDEYARTPLAGDGCIILYKI